MIKANKFNRLSWKKIKHRLIQWKLPLQCYTFLKDSNESSTISTYFQHPNCQSTRPRFPFLDNKPPQITYFNNPILNVAHKISWSSIKTLTPICSPLMANQITLTKRYTLLQPQVSTTLVCFSPYRQQKLYLYVHILHSKTKSRFT